MRILHLTPELPYVPGGGGGATRQFHLLRRLVELGHEVTVVAPTTEAELRATRASDVMRDAGIDFRPSIRRGRPLEVASALLRRPGLASAGVRWPLYAWQFELFWVSVRRHAARLVDELRPDVVVVEHDDAAGWGRDLAGRVPCVLTAHNVSWRLWQSRTASVRGVRAPVMRLEAVRHRHYTAEHISRFDTVVAVSDADADELRALGARNVAVVPNGAACGEFAPAPDHADPPTLLFTGSMHHPPNPEGITWFVRAIWPAIVERVQEVRLVIVGRGPQRKLRHLARDPRIEVIGPVPSMGPYYANATAVIVPLLSGSGTRLKVLEALASGRAVVSTRVGAAGLELEHGKHLLIEDEAARFAAAAVELLDQAELRQSLAAAGRGAVCERYDWSSLGERLERILESVVARPAASVAGGREASA